jgi:multidrug efflux system membrane fusion protein
MNHRLFLTYCLLAAGLGAGAASAASFDATVRWAQRVELGTPVSGIVKTVDAEPGARAKQGDVLVALDETPFKASVAEAQAAVDRHAHVRLEARRELDRAKELYAREVLSTVELNKAELDYGLADGAWREAVARLELAGYRLEHSRVVAPFDAVVLERRAEPGQGVAADLQPAVLMVVARADAYVARALVPADQVGGVTVGQAARVAVAGNSYEASVASVGMEPAAAQGGPLYPVDVRFAVQGSPLRAGVPATVELR